MIYKKSLSVLVVALLVVSVFGAVFGSVSSVAERLSNETTSASTFFAGGNGTESDPYIIENVDQLQNMNSNLTAHYELANDIDASKTSGWTNGFDPVGKSTDPFTGSLDGKGYYIESLYIDRTGEDYIGLFGVIDGPSLSNVSLTDADVSGNGQVGGLAGHCLQNSVVFETGVSGNVNGDNDLVGGLIGSNSGSVERSYAMVHVNASGANNVGGLIGSSNGPVNSSFSTGDVEGSGVSGGLIGSFSGATVNNSYATGNVSGSASVGGLMGSISESSLVENSYAAGDVNGGDYYVGGLIGMNDGTSSVEDSFWDTETSGQSTSAGGTGKTTAEMKDVSTFTNTSSTGLTEPWDFIGDPYDDVGSKDIWDIDENKNTNDGYPFLDWAGSQLTINIQGSGTVYVDGQEVADGWNNTFLGNKEVELEATPDAGWEFENWTGDVNGTENLTNVNMDGDKQITANFYEPAAYYTLDIYSVGNGTVEVNGNEVGTPFNQSYSEGEVIDIVATPDECNEFINWTGDYTSLEKEINITMDADKAITANFQEVEVAYNITDWDELCHMRCDLDGDYTLKNDINESTKGYNDTHIVTDEVEEKLDSSSGGSAGDTLELFYTPVEEILYAEDLGSGSEVSVSLVDSYDGIIELNEGTEGRLLVEYRITEEVFMGWKPVGEERNRFTGSFNGQEYNITGLNISRPHAEKVGLFGHIDHGSVSNLSLLDVNVTGKHEVGGLVGRINGSITNTYVTGKVLGHKTVGGLAAVNGLYNIEDSHASADVYGVWEVGGLVGLNVVSSVNNSYATGKVIGIDESIWYASEIDGWVGGKDVGGLVGMNWGNVTNSYATGNVSGTGPVGGLVGSNIHRVYNSYATGDINGKVSLGGLVGVNGGPSSVKDSYSIGNVSGNMSLGGLIGHSTGGPIINSHYNIDNVLINGGNHVTTGGLFDAQYQDWIEDKNLDITDYSASLVPSGEYYNVSTVQGLRDLLGFSWDNEKKFQLAGNIDLSSAPGLYIPYIDTEFEGNGYNISNLELNLPFASHLGFLGCVGKKGSGLYEGWYQNVSNFNIVDANVTGGTHVGGLVGYSNDGGVFNSSVTGNISGNGSVGGLVGWNHNGTVENSSADNIEVIGNGSVGGLVGTNLNKVINSFATGTVGVGEGADDEAMVGGLVGINGVQLHNLPRIENSYSTADVSGAGLVGGLAGQNSNVIIDSYATGNVSGGDAAGGLVGFLDGTVSFSYATGNVSGVGRVGGLIGGSYESTVSNSYSIGEVTGDVYFGGLIGSSWECSVDNSFWDTETSRLSSSAGGTGKTTAEMKDIETFTNTSTEGLSEPWDFIDNPYDDKGDKDIWFIDDYEQTNDGYPFLTWEENLYELTLNTQGKGSTIPEEGTHTYIEGDVVTIEAYAGEYYHFTKWSGDDGTIDDPTANKTTIEMLSDYTITAEFEIDNYTLNISSTVGGNVTVPGEDVFEFEHGTIVDLEAVADEGYRFLKWTGENGTIDDPTAGQTTIEMLDNYNITAEFEETVEYELTISTNGEGSTTPAEGTHTYEEGNVVTVEATPASGWEFVEWTGDVTGTSSTIDVTMNANKSVTAVFEEVVEYQLTISINGEGSTTPAEGTHTYEEGNVVTVEAAPADGWEFVEWTGDVTGTSSTIDVTMDADKSVTAVFEMVEYNLIIDIDGEGNTTPSQGTHTYQEGTVVTVEANPDSGWEFIEWTGDVTKTESTINITMDSEKSVTAVFEEMPEYNLTISTNGEGNTTPTEGTHTYEEGTVVTVEAVPVDGWTFSKWTGDVTGTSSSIEVTMDADKSVTAVFEEEIIEYGLTISINGEGSTIPAKGNHTYEEGTVVTVEANPDSGWEFVEWTGDVTSASSSIDVTMDADKSVTAIFEVIEYDLTMNIDGEGSTTPAEGTHTYEEGNVVTVEANPASDWEFLEWTGDITGTASTMDITMNSDKEITANFVEKPKAEFEVTNFNVDTDELKVTITGTVENIGDAEGTIRLREDGEEIASITVQPGETKDVEETHEFDEEGTYTIEFGDQSETVNLEEADDDGTPGFTSLILVLSVVIAVMIYYKKNTVNINK